MCRYAMARYKSHYACFDCQKTFKRRLMWDIKRDDKSQVEAKCPQCGSLMANMGMDFAAPKMNGNKAWQHLRTLYSVGVTFHSCGCTGPGYIPNTTDALIKYLQEQKECAEHHLQFWRSRHEPTNSREIDRDLSKNWDYISKVPDGMTAKKREIKNADAVDFWINRLKEIEVKIGKVNVAVAR
jgi:DNA-directed RNA polymerase subunit RPC12/RpoP